MIFQQTLRWVLASKKTQTRRIARTEKPPCRVGAMLAVQPGRGNKAVGRVLVTGVRKSSLGRLTEADARAEGYRNRAEFIAAWENMHGHYDSKQKVWVITFEPPSAPLKGDL